MWLCKAELGGRGPQLSPGSVASPVHPQLCRPRSFSRRGQYQGLERQEKVVKESQLTHGENPHFHYGFVLGLRGKVLVAGGLQGWLL